MNNFDSSDKSIFVRTKFGTSFFFLWIQAFLPGLVLYFLVSNDFRFTFKLPKWWPVILVCLLLIIVTIAITTITYILHFHELDQYTYAVPFVFSLSYLTLSSYFDSSIWINQPLFRFIFFFLAAIIGMIFTTFFLLLFLRSKSNNTDKNY